MAAKGNIAKQNVENIIRDAFGKNFLGTQDKKLYVLADDGGEMVNIAISMTCPKTAFSAEPSAFDNGNFGQPDVFKPAEITQQETENIMKMMKELGLN